MRSELSIEDRPEQRPQTEAILRRQEVDGAADRRDPDYAPLDQLRPEIRLLERFQPRPQARVRICRYLSLEADEMAHRRHDIEGPAGQEQLPLQRRPVEGSRGDRLRHALTLARYLIRHRPAGREPTSSAAFPRRACLAYTGRRD